jgi:hypothetical protein
MSRGSAIFLSFLLLLLTSNIEADFIQQGGKLFGSDAAGVPGQGVSIAISGDGNTAIVGGSGDSSNLGAAWVWTRSNSVWSQQGGKLVASDAVGNYVYQGHSVALSSDGNTALVGGPGDSSGMGAAWIWVRSNGVWSQQGGKLVGSGTVGDLNIKQGWSVALSGDGNTAMIGGWGDDDNSGAVWVWTRSGGVWSQQGGKLNGSGAVGKSEQGFSVALSADGNTAIVGGHFDQEEFGAAWVWTRTGNVWSQQGSKLVGSDDSLIIAHQGWSVALSGDGNTAMVGGWSDSGGTAWVWKRSGEAWSQQGGKLIGSGNAGVASQGWSVALSSNGNTALIGGPTDSTDCCAASKGAAWVWSRSGDIWSQQGGKLVGAGDSLHMARQGVSVAVSSDGNTLIVGGPGDNLGIGAAWIFTQSISPILRMKSFHPQLTLTDGNSLRFDLPKNEKVIIQLFDANGKLVANLMDESRNAGTYSILLPAGLNGSYDFLDYRAGSRRETMKIGPIP